MMKGVKHGIIHETTNTSNE